jgi:hypothetical protein
VLSVSTGVRTSFLRGMGMGASESTGYTWQIQWFSSGFRTASLHFYCSMTRDFKCIWLFLKSTPSRTQSCSPLIGFKVASNSC